MNVQMGTSLAFLWEGRLSLHWAKFIHVSKDKNYFALLSATYTLQL